mmetsp:Transcript_18366/g.39244  ORF Transcript_18366/g.39244 Transcript_18366/m.39244 type:complete len:205 (-) Transcript_18366:470-1084(-)
MVFCQAHRDPPALPQCRFHILFLPSSYQISTKKLPRQAHPSHRHFQQALRTSEHHCQLCGCPPGHSVHISGKDLNLIDACSRHFLEKGVKEVGGVSLHGGEERGGALEVPILAVGIHVVELGSLNLCAIHQPCKERFVRSIAVAKRRCHVRTDEPEFACLRIAQAVHQRIGQCLWGAAGTGPLSDHARRLPARSSSAAPLTGKA